MNCKNASLWCGCFSDNRNTCVFTCSLNNIKLKEMLWSCLKTDKTKTTIFFYLIYFPSCVTLTMLIQLSERISTSIINIGTESLIFKSSSFLFFLWFLYFFNSVLGTKPRTLYWLLSNPFIKKYKNWIRVCILLFKLYARGRHRVIFCSYNESKSLNLRCFL